MSPEDDRRPWDPPWPDPHELVPHDRSVVFVDRILHASERHVLCRIVPGTHDQAHVERGMIPAFMGVEYMAQAIAVFAGLCGSGPRRPAIGYVVSIRDLVASVPGFAVGRPLDVGATWQWGESHVGQFHTSIDHEGATLMRATITTYRPPEESR